MVGRAANIPHSAIKPILLKPQVANPLKHGLHAAFDFPLYAEGRLQAVLEFFSTTRQLPDKHLLYIVESIGEQLGRVLERRQGHEQQRQAVAISDALNLTTIRSNALGATLDALIFGVYLTDCPADRFHRTVPLSAKSTPALQSALRIVIFLHRPQGTPCAR